MILILLGEKKIEAQLVPLNHASVKVSKMFFFVRFLNLTWKKRI